MIDFVVHVLSLLVTLSILVTIHEWGHYRVARWCGVKVLRFSIGFGTPFLRWVNKAGTEFALAPIPLGGYVKMLDTREGTVSEADYPYSFNAQPLWQRASIVAAGPLINLLFAVLIFWALFMKGVSYTPIVLAEPEPNTPAAEAGIHAQMQLTHINDKIVRGWRDVVYELASVAGEETQLAVQVIDANQQQQQLSLTAHQLFKKVNENPLQVLGLAPQFDAVIGLVEPTGAAKKAGFLVGDKVVQVNGENIASWMAWVKAIQAHPERQLNVMIIRAGVTKTLQLTPQKRLRDDKEVGYAGVGLLMDNSRTRLTRLNPWQAFKASIYDVQRSFFLNLSMLKKIATQQISAKHLGGPVVIAEAAKNSLFAGMQSFLHFLAEFSIMLGLMNLLPIPVLDGGHLLFMAYEAIMRKPPSEKWQTRLTVMGMALMALFMTFVLFNDSLRLFALFNL